MGFRLRRLFENAKNPSPEPFKGLDSKTRSELLSSTNLSSDLSNMRSRKGLLSAYWTSEEKWKARSLGIVIAALTFADVYLGVKITEWPGHFVDAVLRADPDVKEVAKRVAEFTMIAAGFAGAWNTRYYFEKKLQASWRGWLTDKFSNSVLNNKAFYHITKTNSVPNLDQRLTEDLKDLVSHMTDLGTGGLRASLAAIAFTNVLYNMTGSQPVEILGKTFNAPSSFFWSSFGAAAVCAVLGTMMVRKYGKPSISLNENYIRSEGEMRSNLHTMFLNSKEIASYHGQIVEKGMVKRAFDKVKSNMLRYELMQAKVGGMLGLNNDASKLVGWGMGGVNYTLGNVFTAGSIITYAGIFDGLRNAMAWPMQVTPMVFRVRTISNFLNSLAENVEQSKDLAKFYELNGKSANIKIVRTVENNIQLNNIIVKDSINEKNLMRVPKLNIKTGERILLTGKSGGGKSLLIGIMNGVWPHGEGEAIIPLEDKIFYAPQVAHVMGNVTLESNIIYPAENADQFKSRDVEKALQQAELGYLIPFLKEKDREGTSWHNLSVGEKQRLIFARIFLHKPEVITLDEATSGLDSSLQALMYERLIKVLPKSTIISIAHRDGLDTYHTRHLEVKEGALLDHGDFPLISENDALIFTFKQNRKATPAPSRVM